MRYSAFWDLPLISAHHYSAPPAQIDFLRLLMFSGFCSTTKIFYSTQKKMVHFKGAHFKSQRVISTAMEAGGDGRHYSRKCKLPQRLDIDLWVTKKRLARLILRTRTREISDVGSSVCSITAGVFSASLKGLATLALCCQSNCSVDRPISDNCLGDWLTFSMSKMASYL